MTEGLHREHVGVSEMLDCVSAQLGEAVIREPASAEVKVQTAALPPPSRPVAGESITVARVVGRVTVTLPGSGRAQVLTGRSTIPSARAPRTRPVTAKKTRSRKLWVNDRRGSWRTRGKFAAATAKGTKWTIADTCTTTTVSAVGGTVVVRPLDGRKSVDVSAPHRHVVHAP
jgi:hypothetical protein